MSYLNFDFIELNQNMYKMAIVSYWTLILVDVNLLPIFAFVLQSPPPQRLIVIALLTCWLGDDFGIFEAWMMSEDKTHITKEGTHGMLR